ncbi:MAG: type II toxin-antitoxin system RelE/ParE family toxin [Acidobacteria bacterium]|nr:type II toxin-antitoxin system RelE/ParE family toxin [Acidobacteriota bacterium]
MNGSYSVHIGPAAEREILALPKADRIRVVRRINGLAQEPRPAGCKKLKGTDGYRIRQGDYRILYTIEDIIRIVAVYAVRNRKEAYRD